MVDRKHSLLLRALTRQAVPRTPVWLMRQAGRYLPEYRKIRKQAGDFLSLCKNPQLACEVALQPLRRYDLDAAILFSDILTIPDALGLGLYFAEGEGPGFHHPLRNHKAINNLPAQVDLSALNYVFQAVELTRQAMPSHLPLIGFAGSPWTLACYMVEGKGGREFKQAMTLLYKQPKAMQQLLNKLTQSVISYLIEQVKAGVDAIMVFDTWGGLLTTPNYHDFSLHYLTQIVHRIKQQFPTIPIILFTKGGGLWLETLALSGCDALGLDWTCDLGRARKRTGGEVALQGNLDPAVLLADKTAIRHQVQQVLASYGYGDGHVFNLGHGITPDVSPDKVAIMIEAVHEFSPQFHGG